MTEEDQYDLIDRFLSKDLGKAELDAFNLMLLSDAVFAEKFEARKEMHNLIVEGRLLRLKEKIALDLSSPTFYLKDNFWSITGYTSLSALVVAGIVYLMFRTPDILPQSNNTEDSIPQTINKTLALDSQQSTVESTSEVSEKFSIEKKVANINAISEKKNIKVDSNKTKVTFSIEDHHLELEDSINKLYKQYDNLLRPESAADSNRKN